nr:putative reverse transcriptase domain-containing protein [Tanacetum cinerariifolium]
PFEILKRIGIVAYRLRLHKALNSVHDTFHVSNLKKCLADANLHVPLDEIKVDKTLCVVEETVEIMDRETKKLKHRKIALLKVRWNSKRGPEFTCEHEDQMRINDDESWGDSEDESDDVHDKDDNNNDDGNDDDNGNDDDSGNDDDGGNDAQNSKQTDLDDDENPSFTLNNYKEEEQDEEYVHILEKDKSDDEEKMYEEEDDDVVKELYGDLNVDREDKDADMTYVEQGRADQQNASHESMFVHEEEDAHVTLTTVHDKTEGPLQSSSFSSEFTSKLLNFDDPSPDINSLMDTLTVPSPPPPVNPSPHLTILKEEVNVAVWLQSNKLREEAQAENQEFINQVDSTMKAIIKEHVLAKVTKIMPQIRKYVTETLGAEVLVRSTNQPQTSYDVAASLSEFENDWFKKPEKPLTPDHPWNKRKATKSRPPQTWISNISKTRQPPRKLDELMSTLIDFSAYVMNNLKIDYLSQEILVGPVFNLLKGTCKSFAELEYHFEECYKAVNDKLDWNNPEGHAYPFDLSKPMPLIRDRGHQVVPIDYFISNDLEYLKGGSKSSKYATSTTRTKAAKYDNIEDIEDMVPALWSPVKVATTNMLSGELTNVKVMRWYDYRYLEVIVVRRDDNVLFKFKEGDFPRLNLQNQRDLPRDISLDSVEVLSMDGRDTIDVSWNIAKFLSDKAKRTKKKSMMSEADAGEARRAQEEEGDVRHHPNMSFTNRLRAMDDRLGDIDFNIYTLSNEFGRIRLEQDRFHAWNTNHMSQPLSYHHINHTCYDGTWYSYVANIPDLGVQQGVNIKTNPQIFSIALTAPDDLFDLFGTPSTGPSTSHNPKNYMDEE